MSCRRPERIGPTGSAPRLWNTSANRVMLSLTISSITMSASFMPLCGRAPGALSIFTMSAGSAAMNGSVARTPVNGYTGGGGSVVVVTASVVVGAMVVDVVVDVVLDDVEVVAIVVTVVAAASSPPSSLHATAVVASTATPSAARTRRPPVRRSRRVVRVVRVVRDGGGALDAQAWGCT